MTNIDARGIIAAVEIAIYVPLLITSIILVKRHGFKRSGGWLFFVIFSIVRIVGASIHIAAELESSYNVTLHIIYGVLEGAGLQPLLGATLGFLGTVAQNGLDAQPIVPRGLRLLGLLSTVALALSVAGGIVVGNAKTMVDVNRGTSLRHVGVILFVVLFVLIFFVHVFYWSNKESIMKYRQKLLLGISIALPFLGLRVVYTLLSGFAPAAVPGKPPATGGLSDFNSQTGSWPIYLVMSVLAEFATVLIYTVVGITTPLGKDYASSPMADDEQSYSLKPV